MMQEKEYRYWLCNVAGMGARKIASLLQYFGSAQEVWSCREILLMAAMKELTETFYHGEGQGARFQKADLERLCQARQDLEQAVENYHNLEKQGIGFITPEDPAYPKRLNSLYDMPQGLYIKGEVPSCLRPAMAIVGARNCSHYGRELAFYIAKELCDRGVDIISGMAMGIDGAAHRGALAVCAPGNRKEEVCSEALSGKEEEDRLETGERTEEGPGRTYGVLGSGVDVCYPRCNRDIYEILPQAGGLLSEYPLGTGPYASNFPLRNRLISGLADGVIVIEARFRSGSLITADQALEQGRDVYAIPGRVTDPLSRGCNELIRQGAEIITDPVEFINNKFSKQDKKILNGRKNKITLALSEEKVYSCLDFSPKHIGAIVNQTGLSAQDIINILMYLKKFDLVVETTKNYYALKFR